MKSLLDPSFRYTPSFATNLKNTFDKAHRKMRQAQANSPEARGTEVKGNVLPMDRERTAR